MLQCKYLKALGEYGWSSMLLGTPEQMDALINATAELLGEI